MAISTVCTLFEGNYHYGTAVLINSLYNNGFRGRFYAGYKGVLPGWCTAATPRPGTGWEGASGFLVAEGLELVLLPLTTAYHLTNYKPDFMIRLLEGPAADADCIFYLDPDIVATAPWFFLKDWATAGVAVCEDINSPLQEHHPKRVAWRRIFARHGLQLSFKTPIYVNGGCVGVAKEQTDFLYLWKKIQEYMGAEIGGLNRSIFTASEQLSEKDAGDFSPFGKTDQDALNAAIEAYEGNISFMGKEAMNLSAGLYILPHALGAAKPWKINLTQAWLKKGFVPRAVDMEYWRHAGNPIPLYSDKKIKRTRFSFKAVSFLTRFYSNRK